MGNVDERGEPAIDEAAERLALPREQVEIAVRYYSCFGDQIDGWIARVDEEARRVEAAWEQRRAVLG